MEFPKTLAAAKRVRGAEWALADALLEEVGPRGGEARFRECHAFLAARGIDYTDRYLRDLHSAARRFPPADRPAWLTPANAWHAGTPDVVEHAVEVRRERAEREGTEYRPPAQADLQRARRTVHHHERTRKGLAPMPTPNPAARRKPSQSELRRTSDLLALTGYATEAARAGRKFVEAIAGAELSDEEREEFEADVERVLETWRACRTAVRNPLSRSLDAFLESLE